MSYAKSGGDSNRIDNAAAGYMCITHALRGEGFDASEDGTGRGTPLVPVAFATQQTPKGWDVELGTCPTLQVPSKSGGGQQHCVAYGFQSSQSGVRQVDTHATLDANNGSRRHNGVAIGSAVRRLTPRECERLQGFPDDYTLVPHRGKPMADGPRYKALGNSMAVPVMRWIGERIAMVDAIKQDHAASSKSA